MRLFWCLLWLAVLVAIVLSIPLIDRPSGGLGHPSVQQGQDSPLLPAPRQQP